MVLGTRAGPTATYRPDLGTATGPTPGGHCRTERRLRVRGETECPSRSVRPLPQQARPGPFYCTGLLRRSWGRCVGLPEPELVPLRVGAGLEPAHGRNGHRRAGLPAELGHTRRTRVDVVVLEVR